MKWLQQIIGPEEFIELRAEELLYPRGERRSDARHAINTLWTVRAYGGGKNADYDDFVPEFEFERTLKPEQTVEQAVMLAMKINAMAKGTFH